jgi:hypothetical protein
MGSAPLRLATLGVTSLLLVTQANAGRSQGMLAGCRLVNGSLQCVQGLTTSPQQQIQILDGEISQDQEVEGAIEQTIQNLKRFELVGKARQGELLRAELMLQGETVQEVHIHWYRRQVDGSWMLVDDISESTYRIGPEDAGASVMAVLTVQTDDGSVRRLQSNAIGPVPTI